AAMVANCIRYRSKSAVREMGKALGVPETDLETVIRHVIQIRKQREWDPILESLHDWIPELEKDPTDDAAVFAQRLRAMEELVAMADTIVERLLKGGTVTNLGLKLLVSASKNANAPSVVEPTSAVDSQRTAERDGV
ncbi:MAG: hypothetical protein AAGA81_18815, partial [Acidobacteriota bacterium]